MKTIGIKLADGSFFPIMEDGSTQTKKLELTTANNNQTCVMVDVYQSESGTMDDAEYIDTLKIENLIEHPNGEANIAFTIQLDEDGQLKTDIQDEETGASSNSSISLVTRTADELTNTDDYTITESLGLTEEPAADTTLDALPDFDLDTPAADETVSEALPDFDLDTPAAEETVSEDLPDFDLDTPAADETVSEDLPDFDLDTPATDETVSDDLPDFDLDTTAADETISEDLPDFDLDTPAADETVSDDLPDFDMDTPAAEDSISNDLPDFSSDTPIEEESFSESLPDFDLDTPAEEDSNFIPSGGESPLNFDGLYDKETAMGDSAQHEEPSAKKSKLYVWICLICAIICVIATAILLILIPAKYGTKTKGETSPDAIELSELAAEQKQQEEKNETPKAPAAKDNEIVVIKEAAVVEPLPVSKTNSSNIKYKLKWGDTLWDIAYTYYKNPWKYKKIANYNNIKNPDHIISGTVIVIPAE